MLRVWCAVAVCLLVAGTAGADDLSKRLTAAIATPALEGARVSVYVVNLGDGSVRFSHHAERALIPASNMKILTALAALSMFGPTHQFVTKLYADVQPGNDGTIDVLGVRGGGDPALTSEQWWRLAADLRVLGIRRIKRGLLLDATRFDSEYWHPEWGVISARAYNAPVGALNANYGAYSITVRGGAWPGEPVSALIDPPVAHLRLINRAKTVASRAPAELAVDRRRLEAGEEVVVSGQVRAGSARQTHYRSVLQPVHYAGSVLRMQLEANGIEVGTQTRVGTIGAEMPLLMSFEGEPLAQITSRFLKYSNNAIAETLVKAMGAHRQRLRSSTAAQPGSWRNGVVAMRDELEGLGIDLTDMVITDGSGLSYENRLTSVALVSALRIASDSFQFGSEFQAALPIAAADGTLEKRARSSAEKVRAKTGLLTRVTSLSGYANNAEGERLVFSILVNGFRRGAQSAMSAVDAIAFELTR